MTLGVAASMEWLSQEPQQLAEKNRKTAHQLNHFGFYSPPLAA